MENTITWCLGRERSSRTLRSKTLNILSGTGSLEEKDDGSRNDCIRSKSFQKNHSLSGTLSGVIKTHLDQPLSSNEFLTTPVPPVLVNIYYVK